MIVKLSHVRFIILKRGGFMETKSIRKLALTVNTIILMLVFGLMSFFYICKVHFLTIFSIPTSMIYLIGYFLIYKNRLDYYVWMVFSWLTLYMGITTICLGYNYGFHLYCFSMIPTMFVSEYISHKLKKNGLKALRVSLIIAVFYLICTGYVSVFGPVYQTNIKAATVFWIFNAITVFSFLIYYSNYLIRSIIRSEEKLLEIAHVDRLTQLYNRHYMTKCMEAISCDGTGSFLAMADIDKFKNINDTYGHNGGDEVLKTVSSIMKNECEGCEVARWGGEEFLILSATPLSDGKDMMEKLRKKIESSPVHFEGKEIHVTITIGVAIRQPEQSLDSWISEADKKLYFGKNNGRNRVIE